MQWFLFLMLMVASSVSASICERPRTLLDFASLQEGIKRSLAETYNRPVLSMTASGNIVSVVFSGGKIVNYRVEDLTQPKEGRRKVRLTLLDGQGTADIELRGPAQGYWELGPQSPFRNHPALLGDINPFREILAKLFKRSVRSITFVPDGTVVVSLDNNQRFSFPMRVEADTIVVTVKIQSKVTELVLEQNGATQVLTAGDDPASGPR